MGVIFIWLLLLSSGVISLVCRNLIASIDKVFLIWQVVFPIVYIFIAGYSYSSLIEEHGIRVGHAMVTYPAYLAVKRLVKPTYRYSN
jgi:hypothetical protein